METQVHFNIIWVYTFLEHTFVFFCKVQGVLVCIVHLSKLEKLGLTKRILDSNGILCGKNNFFLNETQV